MTRNIWIGIIVVIALVVGGWWYLNQSSAPATSDTTQFPTIQNTNTAPQTAMNPAPVQQAPKTTTQPNPTPAKSAYLSGLQNVSLSQPTLNTVAWLQYNDAQSGISFKYDPSWKVSKVSGSAADNILVIGGNTNVSFGIYYSKSTIDDLVRAQLRESCNGCVYRDPIIRTLPSGNYVVEVYAYDTYNKIDMHPGTFYFGDDSQQFFMRSDGAGAAAMSILSTLNF